MPGPLTESQVKQRILRELTRRFLLRFHIALILIWTFCAGLLATKLLLWAGSDSMLVRYPLAVVVSYLAFLLGVRLWLEYVDLGRHLRRDEGDYWDVPTDFPTGIGRSSGRGVEPFQPGGGNFGGGGAGARFEVEGAALPADAGAVAESTAGAPGAAAEGAWLGAAAGEGCLPVLIGALILGALALVAGAGAWVVAETPAILVEAAFEALLAGGLIRARRRIEDADWLGAVFRATWLPFVIALIAAVAFGIAAQHYKPQARTVFDVFAWTQIPTMTQAGHPALLP